MYYIAYLARARHRKGHGIHSPYAFDFACNVLFGADTVDYAAITKRRRELLNDRTMLTVEDHGAGSRTGTGKRRAVRHLAGTAAVKPRFGRLLARFAAWYRPDVIIELGTGAGISTAYLGAGHPGCTLITVEGSKTISGIARQTLNEAGLPHVQQIHGLFSRRLPSVLDGLKGCDSLLVFIDGDHVGESMLFYADQVLSCSFENVALVLDDIHWSASMAKAWHELVCRSEITVSLDIFQFGILFVKKGVTKQHYVVRF